MKCTKCGHSTPSPSACKASPSGCKSESAEKVIAAAIKVIHEHNNVLGETLYDKYTSVFKAVAVLSRELAAYQKESE